ncbi:unnamed protein product [Boreogadus saida]
MPTKKKCIECREEIGVASKVCAKCGSKQPYKAKLEERKRKMTTEWRELQKKNSSLNKVYDSTNLQLHKWELLERHPLLLLGRKTPEGFHAECLCPWELDSEDFNDAIDTIRKIYEDSDYFPYSRCNKKEKKS